MEKKNRRPDNFGREVTIKGIVIAGMLVLMLIPWIIILNKVSEREQRKDEAVEAISDKWSGKQTVCGPVLTIPFVKQVEDKMRKGRFDEVWTNISFTPSTLDVKASLTPEIRRYGMYEATLYTSSIEMDGQFAPTDFAGIDAGRPDLSKAYITMELSDMRGLSGEPAFNFGGKQYRAEAGGSRERYGDNYYTAKQLTIKPDITSMTGAMTFDCRMDLKGSEGLHFVPIGQTTDVELYGAWPNPSFTGSFSPEHNVGKGTEDFTARWTVLHYNRDIPSSWEGGMDELTVTSFGVELVTGTDQYQQNERAMKYAMLFIVLTFVVFFFVELLTYKRIHPVQYLLVGVALLMFYTLLLSISEITGFGRAYLVSAVATVGLITAYSASIFRNRRETLLLGSILAFLYAYLYFILQLENYTLLVGSIGMFVILAVIMSVSRKVNWYKTDGVES